MCDQIQMVYFKNKKKNTLELNWEYFYEWIIYLDVIKE